MNSVIRVETEVLPGGRIEIEEPGLAPGEAVEVIVIRQASRLARRPALEILAEAPGHLLFKTAEDVDTYLQEERDSWDR